MSSGAAARADGAVRETLERTIREEHGRIVAVLARVLGTMDEAEDVLQSAVARALERWPRSGVPSSPGAWLTTVARRIAIDAVRRRRTAERLHETLERDEREHARLASTGGRLAGARGRLAGARGRAIGAASAGGIRSSDDPYDLLGRWPDERLRLVFLCCHPELDAASRQALTLREVCGLSTGEVARAFLVSEPAMAQRLVRAKRRLRERGARLELPPPDEFDDRLADVLRVIYLLFNQGYLAHGERELIRDELCDFAVWLARTLNDLLAVELRPEHPEVLGLTALLLLLHARRHARTGSDGLPVVLEEQDRTLWVREEADEGLALLDRAVAHRAPGPYQIKAAINALHHTATDAADTDWTGIAALYDRLVEFEPTQVVRLNAIVARGMAYGPHRALDLLDELATLPDFRLATYPYYHLARARFLEDAGRPDEARGSLQAAHDASDNAAERRFIRTRLAALPRGTTAQQ